MMSSSVVLPDPFGPTTARRAPGSITRSTPWKTVVEAAPSVPGKPLADIDQLDDMVPQACRSGAELQVVGTDTQITRTTGDDLTSGAQAGLRLRRARRSPAAEPGKFLARKDLARRLLVDFPIDPLGAGVEVRRVGA